MLIENLVSNGNECTFDLLLRDNERIENIRQALYNDAVMIAADKLLIYDNNTSLNSEALGSIFANTPFPQTLVRWNLDEYVTDQPKVVTTNDLISDEYEQYPLSTIVIARLGIDDRIHLQITTKEGTSKEHNKFAAVRDFRWSQVSSNMYKCKLQTMDHIEAASIISQF